MGLTTAPYGRRRVTVRRVGGVSSGRGRLYRACRYVRAGCSAWRVPRRLTVGPNACMCAGRVCRTPTRTCPSTPAEGRSIEQRLDAAAAAVHGLAHQLMTIIGGVRQRHMSTPPQAVGAAFGEEEAEVPSPDSGNGASTGAEAGAGADVGAGAPAGSGGGITTPEPRARASWARGHWWSPDSSSGAESGGGSGGGAARAQGGAHGQGSRAAGPNQPTLLQLWSSATANGGGLQS